MRRIAIVSLFAALAAGCATSTTDDPPGGGTGGIGGGGTGGVDDFGAPAGWADQVALRELPDLDPDPAVLEVDLEARVAEVEYRAGVKTEVWTYDGTVPGPLLRAKVGDTLVVHFTNNLPEETTIHWHGVRVPAEMDGAGHMAEPIAAGGTFEFRFELRDAGTFWFHPHVRSNEQVEKGLYGAILVEDPAQPVLGDAVTLVFDDVQLLADGTLAPPGSGGHMEEMIGRQGNTLLVNGRQHPTLLARSGRRQHWRLVNAANARYFHLSIPGYSITRVGGDAGLLTAPVESETLLLVPGERAEIVLTPVGDPGEKIAVRNLPYERGHHTGMADPMDLFSVEIADLPATGSAPLPEPLGSIEAIDAEGIPALQNVVLDEVMEGMEMVFLINGKAWPEVEPLTATVGETQVWQVENLTEMDHPFHLHGFFFQVIGVNGVETDVLEWKDTVNIPADSRLRFAVKYDDRPGGWMFHCHILEHAELGMMGELLLEP